MGRQATWSEDHNNHGRELLSLQTLAFLDDVEAAGRALDPPSRPGPWPEGRLADGRCRYLPEEPTPGDHQ